VPSPPIEASCRAASSTRASMCARRPAFQVVRVSPLKFKPNVTERFAPDGRLATRLRCAAKRSATVLTGESCARSGDCRGNALVSDPKRESTNPGEQFKPVCSAASRSQTEHACQGGDGARGGHGGLLPANPRVFRGGRQTARERTIEIDGKVRGRSSCVAAPSAR